MESTWKTYTICSSVATFSEPLGSCEENGIGPMKMLCGEMRPMSYLQELWLFFPSGKGNQM